MKNQIIVDVLDDGEVRIETRGYSGPVCLAEAKFLKDVLGEEVSRQLTSAYYQQEGNVNKKTRKIVPLCG